MITICAWISASSLKGKFICPNLLPAALEDSIDYSSYLLLPVSFLQVLCTSTLQLYWVPYSILRWHWKLFHYPGTSPELTRRLHRIWHLSPEGGREGKLNWDNISHSFSSRLSSTTLGDVLAYQLIFSGYCLWSLWFVQGS